MRDGNSMTVETRSGTPNVRKVTHLLNLSAGVSFGVHNSTLVNVVRGVQERVFFRSDGTPPPDVDDSALDKLQDFSNEMRKLSVSTVKLTYDQFVNCYFGRRRIVYGLAVISLLHVPLSVIDALIKTFVKAEKINLTKKGDPAPRVIQPRSARFNVELGRYTKHLEPRLYKAVKKIFGEHTIFKGLNALQSGKRLRTKWDLYTNPIAVGLDASRFDQHVRRKLLMFEHRLYENYYPGDRYLQWLLSLQLKNKCVAFTKDGKVKYQVDGSRMSGDMNTAVGNCLIMCALVWTFLKEKGVRASLANNGDDCVLIMEKRDECKLQGLQEWFLGFGFEMKVEATVSEFEQIEFCQTSPVWTPEGYIMVRNPLNGIDKDNVSFDNITNERSWRNACGLIGECGLHLAGHIPLYNQLYRKLAKVGGVTKAVEPDRCGMWWLSRGLDNSNTPVHYRTRYSFWLAFGITPDTQAAWESELQQVDETYQPNRLGLNKIFDTQR